MKMQQVNSEVACLKKKKQRNAQFLIGFHLAAAAYIIYQVYVK